ncbi:hypothetical protein IT409_02225 [Candidatus Falkowbacteria bacterium]|nr:hypothetical protein [Candidatus Falkowbacteria bacterium]
MDDLTNKFFDINKLPAEWGIILFPISMSRIANSQSPDACLEYIRKISPSKILAPTIGLNFLYGDSLYLDNFIAENTSEDAHKKRMIYMQEVEKHKFGMLNLIDKLKTTEFQIPWAVDFMSWSQALINTKSYATRYGQLKKIYEKDKLFQKYLKDDVENSGRIYNEAQINFFLEEHLLCYLISRGEVSFHNNHVRDQQKWILWCYPGKPPKALIYLHQLNPFKLSWKENKFETAAQYDLLEKKLYDTKNIDLETYSL